MSFQFTHPRQAQIFRFVRYTFNQGVVELVYAFDDGNELLERIVFPKAPTVAESQQPALMQALALLHLIAGVSYYKAAVPNQFDMGDHQLDAMTQQLLTQVYTHGLAEFAYQNQLDLTSRINFPISDKTTDQFDLNYTLPQRALIPIGGGKDSLVTANYVKQQALPATLAWVGHSELIASCAARTQLPTLNIERHISTHLFEMNRHGAYNGHIPVTAINSAILTVACVLYGYDALIFSNEHSASAATINVAQQHINHQWSKSLAFEKLYADWVRSHINAKLQYFSLLRPFSELAITRQFAKLSNYHDVFSSCNRNFKITGDKPESRWCGQCPKCHFVFLALAPFLPKPQLMKIFGKNYLDDMTLAPAFDALLEWHAHKPFECVGETQESRAAFLSLTQHAAWHEDALIQRFQCEILPHLDGARLQLIHLVAAHPQHHLPEYFVPIIHAFK